MTDVFTKEKRSSIMAVNKGRGNKSTELLMKRLLEEAGISGWREDAIDKPGKPDFVFELQKIALFVDGCFWHGCQRCKNIPKTNTEFWTNKINRTLVRDAETNQKLQNLGWRVIRVWEHELKKSANPQTIIQKIKVLLQDNNE